MATLSQIEEVRHLIDDLDSTDEEFSNEFIGKYIDSEGCEVCAAKKLYQLRISKLGKEVAKGVKSSSMGIEKHDFQSLKDQLEYYKSMYTFYKEECDKENGYGSMFVKSKRTNVGGVITQDEVDELVES